MTKPCHDCPWTKKGQPDLDDALRARAESGVWFCCHVRLGTCIGAENYGQRSRDDKSRGTQRAELLA